jgi:hypothetical protein
MNLNSVQVRIDAAQESRKEGRKALGSGDAPEAKRHFDTALSSLTTGFEILEKLGRPDQDDPTAHDLATAKLYAELFGVRGGTFRDMIRLDPSASLRAIEAYDCGAKYERDFKLLSTYNTVNQLILRILSDPGLLQDPSQTLTLEFDAAGTQTAPLEEWFRRAEVAVERNLDQRRRDKAWAYNDLLLLSTLQPASDLSRWREKLEQQIESGGDKFPFESLLQVVRELCRRRSPVFLRLADLAEWLRNLVPESMRGDPVPEPKP